MLDIFIPEEDEKKINIRLRSKTNNLQALAVAKLLAALAKRTSRALQAGNLREFDALVTDNFCQGRAIYLLLHAKQGELIDDETLEDRASKKESEISELQTKTKNTRNVVIEIGPYLLNVSEKTAFLCQAYLLTIVKQVEEKPDRDIERTNYGNLKSVLSKELDTEIAEVIVARAQSELAKKSIAYLQEQASKLTVCPDARYIEMLVKEKHILNAHGEDELELPSSCAYYNMKVIMLRIQEEQAYVLVKNKNTEASIQLFYRSDKPEGPFRELDENEVQLLPKETPVFVIEGYIPEGMNQNRLSKAIKTNFLSEKDISEAAQESQLKVLQDTSPSELIIPESAQDLQSVAIKVNSLFELVMAGVAQEPQYAGKHKAKTIDDPDALSEMKEYIEKARKIGCHQHNKSLFYIDHTYCATIERENYAEKRRLQTIAAKKKKGGVSHEINKS